MASASSVLLRRSFQLTALCLSLLALVGCDGVIGSEKRLDKCGVCGGNDSTCHVISGIFTRTRLPTGYNRVTSVPRGACNINVTELIVSPNHLAIRVTNGRYIVNGDPKSLGHSGDFPGVGTVFSYRRPSLDDPGLEPAIETILAAGPINESIEIMVVQENENRGIMYSYTVPTSSRQHQHGVRHQGGRHHHSTTTASPTAENSQQQQQPHHHRGNNSSSSALSSRDRVQSDQEQQNERIYRDYQELARRQYEPQRRHLPAAATPADDDTLQSDDTGTRTGDDTRKSSGQQQQQQRIQPGVNYGLSAQRYLPPGQYGIQPHQQPYQSPAAAWPYAGQQVVPPVISPYQQPVVAPQYPVPVNPYQSRPYVLPAPQQPYYLAPGHSALHDRQPSPYDYYRHHPPSPPLNDQTSLLQRSISDDDVAADYAWKIAGFGECSQTCGGGLQETQVVCMKVTGTQVIVTDENCDPAIKPTTRSVTCNNTPCPAAWDATEWSECSTSCDRGQQTRTVECKQRISSVLIISVTANRCIHEPRPHTIRACNEDKPCVRWKIGEWSQCSTECGRGQRTREVICVNTEDKQIAENKCDGSKPRTNDFCDMGSCARTWFYTTWSEECSTDCGDGVHHRLVHCSAEPQRCNDINRPKSEKACKNEVPCGGQWFAGPWGQCTVTCGDGVVKRDVVCMKKLGAMMAVVGEENCLVDEKPETEEQCEQDPCEPRWYITDWSECSRSCDTGLQNREIKCLDADQQPSQSCDPELRPEVRQTCNVHACPSSSRPSSQQSSDRRSHHGVGSCKDKFKNCRVVVQARLCRYPYYREVCCFSCISHGYEDSTRDDA